jgi:hypothetical protein
MRNCIKRWMASEAVIVIASLALVADVGDAAVVRQYDANIQSPAPAPNSVAGGGFTAGGTNGGNITNIGAGNELGTNYWNVVDDNPGGVNAAKFYFHNLVAADFSDPSGWWARVTARIPSASNTSSGTILEVRNAADYYGIMFVNDGVNEFIGYPHAAGGVTTLINTELDSAYVTVDAAYDPTTTNVTVYLNGTPVGTITTANAPNTGINRFGFGSNNSPATGVQHWALVQLNSGAIPEPASLGMLSACALLLARRKGQRL